MTGGGGGRYKKGNYLKIQTGLTSKLLFLMMVVDGIEIITFVSAICFIGSSLVSRGKQYGSPQNIRMCKISGRVDSQSKSFDVSESKLHVSQCFNKKSIFGMTYLIYFKASLLYLGFSFQLKENDVDDANRVCTQLSANNCQESLFSGFTNPNKLSFCTLPPTI